VGAPGSIQGAPLAFFAARAPAAGPQRSGL
jgi:hypothetical protein